MTVTRVTTVAFEGIEAREVDVQVQITPGGNRMMIVGLPDKAVAESQERVKSALHAIGLALPPKRIVVNLAPADLPKEGSHYDLPIAMGLLAAMGVLPAEDMAAAPSLMAVINHYKGVQILTPPQPRLADDTGALPDLKDVRGQETAKRALEITAAGGHNLLMIGPPGSGKSMLAARLPGLLPPLGAREALEISMIQSLAGELKDGAIGRRRPFRAPHHSASMAALVGGGLKVRPGEVSLAHQGVLFLDELPEFARQVLDSLRQPIETGSTLVARANAHIRYPSRFQLVAAMNPCRCGYLGDAALACNRAPRCGNDYQSRISGPLYDRIDLHVDVPAVSAADLSLPAPREGSAEVASRVAAARARQAARYEAESFATNAEAEGEALNDGALLEPAARTLLAEAADRMRLSARGYTRALKVARTIADLAGAEATGRMHVAEALSYRRLVLS